MIKKNIKNDFPIFVNAVKNGLPLVYFDSAATSQKPQRVIDAETEWYERLNANVHRGLYDLSQNATEIFENTRGQVAKFLNAKSSRNIVFTKGTTEGVNLVAFSWARKNLKRGDVILLTEMEHHANIVPWQIVAQEKKLVIRYWPLTKTGELSDKNMKVLFDRVKLLAVTHVSNVLGTRNNVKKITHLAHEKGAKVFIDGAQAVGHIKVNLKNISPDFYAFSSHKMFGPTGLGVLYVTDDRYEEMVPYQAGGEMIHSVGWEKSVYNIPPWKFEAGTQSLAQVYGFSAALSYITSLDLGEIETHLQELVSYAYQQLNAIPEVTIYGPGTGKRLGLISFSVAGLHAHDLSSFLNEYNIALRAGHHCAQPLHERLRVEASARISFHVYNTKQEIDYFIDSLKKIIQQWQDSTNK